MSKYVLEAAEGMTVLFVRSQNPYITVLATIVKVWNPGCANIRLEDGAEHNSVLIPYEGGVPTGGYYVMPMVEPEIPEIKASIKGYRQLSADEQALINEGKTLAEACGAYIAKLRLHPQAKAEQAPTSPGDLQPLDQRWVSIGATDIQRGFMAVIRGIAQPTTF